MRSFAELEQDDKVTAVEVGEVLEGYAASGAVISASVVIDLIGRTNPDDTQREQMKASAQKGKDDQTQRRFARDAAAYGLVIQYLNQ